MSATDRNLSAAHAEVKAEIARTDTKTALLLAFVGAVLAGAWSIARDLPLNGPAVAAGGLGLSRLAVVKFTGLRRAVDLTMTGGALLVLAALLALGGAR